MDLYKIVDAWDNVLFAGYNAIASVNYIIKYPRIHNIVKMNKRFKDIHRNERCFIVLNGPSLNNNNLNVLKDEYVFCANYMYKSNFVDVINPTYYCWMDSLIFTRGEEGRKTIIDLQERCPNVDVFMNYRAYNVIDRNTHTYFTYNKHMPSTAKMSYKIDGLSSGYTNVLGYVIGIALYMGFREIYILGLDFEPTGFKHFDEDVDGTAKQEARNYESITHYGSILKAHSEFLGISKYAKKHGIIIKNLNPDSYVRAFDFSTLDEIVV